MYLHCVALIAAALHGCADAQSSPWPLKSFASEPSLHPLLVNITTTGTPSDGLLFLATDGPVPKANGGPLIVDNNGDEVYIAKGHAFNFGSQTYKGSQVLTWWNGTVFPEPVGRGYGNVIIADSSYQIIGNVSLAGNFLTLNASQTFPSNIDLHEIFFTERNSIVVTANNITTTDLTSVGGPSEGYIVDAQFYEIDVDTNEVLFSWRGIDHLDQLPVTDSVLPLGNEGATGVSQNTAWGYFHINAASVFDDGYLISSRFLCSIMAIDSEGNVKWRLQGKTGGDFQLASDAQFCFQHDARHISTSGSEVIISLHDNANSPLTEPDPTTPTSGLVLKLDLEARTAVVVERFLNPQNPIFSSAQGSFESLPDNGVLLGHGFVPVFEEFDSQGQIVATGQFGPVADGQAAPVGGTLSYRTFKSQWTGCPLTPPAVAASRVGDGLSVAMSWNGATEYTGWTILAGNSSCSLAPVLTASKSGFETTVSIGSAAFVQVEATGGDGCGSKAPRLSEVVAISP